MRKKILKLIKIILGSGLIASSVYFFFLPNKIANGGVTGLALSIHTLFPIIPLGYMTLIGSLILFLIGYLMLGKEFSLYTLFGSVCFSTWLIILEHVFPNNKPLVDELIISIIAGAGLSAMGLAIVFRQGASTGGTDIVSKILATFFPISLSTGLMIADGFVVLLLGLVISYRQAIYEIVSISLTSILMEYVLAGVDRRFVMNINTSHFEEINQFILKEMGRGTTIYPAIGGYSQKEYHVILTIVLPREYLKIRKFVAQTDPKAFIYVYRASEVLGEGFTPQSANTPKSPLSRKKGSSLKGISPSEENSPLPLKD